MSASSVSPLSLDWRPMTPEDLDGVVEVARLSFPDHFEGYDCFEERQRLAPETCFVLASETGEIRGYLVAYPFMRNAAPPLNSLIGTIPPRPETLYLHDLALHPETRGGGYTRAVVERLASQAKATGWPMISLVAVNNAADFWARMGFVAQNPVGMGQKLATYGEDAAYMERPL